MKTYNSNSLFLYLTVLFYLQCISVHALERNALFLGNSYTQVNNLPQLISDYAVSMNDTLSFESNTPGGYTLDQHFTNTTSTGKIINGGWDYVVMQEQSQLPSFQDYLSNGPANLSALIEQYNPCARKMFYMTWGRKNGDASNCAVWPPVCTYEGMDSLLYLRYLEMASLNNAEVSPVGYLWRYIRQNYPAIELYASDGSHPSLAGSFAAAASFYSVIFRKDPSLSNYNPGIDSSEAAIIRQAAKTVVFDNISNWDFSNHQPVANFNYSIGNGTNEVIITNHSMNADSYLWEWGDGAISTTQQAAHNYIADGTYIITLTASNCDLDTTFTSAYQKTATFCSHSPRILPDSLIQCPNSQDTLWTQVFDAYQWLDENGNPLIADTNQYLIPSGGYLFSVETTLNNCTERSPAAYVENFNAGFIIFRVDSFSTSTRMDSLCQGDTVLLILQPNKPAGNDFYYQWNKNGIDIPFATDDSMFVTESGDYQIRVHNSYCPTYLYFENIPLHLDFLNCAIGIEEILSKNSLNVYPNPANARIHLDLNKANIQFPIVWQAIDIYGRTVEEKTISNSEMLLDENIYSQGMYIFKLSKNSNFLGGGRFILNKN